MTERQKQIVELVRVYNEGWCTEETLENKLEELFKTKK